MAIETHLNKGESLEYVHHFKINTKMKNYPLMVAMLTHLNKGKSGLFDALNDDWADTSRSHKVELGQLLWNLMTIIQMVMKSM